MSNDGPLFLGALAGPPPAEVLPASARRAASHLRPSALLGVPLDRTTTYRAGTATGPSEIRTASWSLETYSPVLGAELASEGLYDFGNLTLDGRGSVEENLQAIEEAVSGLAVRGYLPILLGGEHLLTLPAYRGAAGGRTPPALFHFDAHADLREEYEGLTLSHATVIRRVADLIGGRHVYQFGIRSGEREEMLWGAANVNRIPGSLAAATRQALGEVSGHQVYCSLDIDVFDPADAPGTGNPEPGGPPSSDVFEAVLALGAAAALGPAAGGIDLIGFDLVEVSPALDSTGRTGVIAAKLLREFLIAREVGSR